jgi:NADPH-dependent 2,4-dienoyl-CoA reductase/sulfur reductase-like enzyme
MISDGRVVVVGASLAGLRAVEALRRDGFAGSLTLVGAEPHRPYDRPPLSKQVLLGEWDESRVFFRQKDGYDPLALELRLGCAALALDASARELHLADGARLPYDGLVIATGGAPRTLPGPHLAGVHVLRSLDDARAVRQALRQGPRVAIVGAGFIGLEVAAVCRKLGLSVTLVETLPVPLAGVLGPRLGERVAELHREAGVELRCGVAVKALLGEAQVRGLALSDGSEVAAELVIVGIGVRPNTAWLEGSGLALDDGVLCDERCASSLPNVVAAGDVARWYNPLFGETMRVEHWTHAVEQANAAVARLLRGPQVEPFAPVPYFWSDQYDVKIQFAGRVRPDDELQLVVGQLSDRKFVATYGRAGRLTGVLGFNAPAQVMQYRRKIAEKAPFPG